MDNERFWKRLSAIEFTMDIEPFDQLLQLFEDVKKGITAKPTNENQSDIQCPTGD